MKLRPKRLNPLRCLNHNLCDVGAVHFQLNYQASLGAGHYVTLMIMHRRQRSVYLLYIGNLNVYLNRRGQNMAL